jgi:hypothetical protein
VDPPADRWDVPEPGRSAMSDHEVASTEPAEVPEEVADPPADAPAGTGNERVDGVVRSLDSLEGRPAEEHVAVFEAAHRELRDALSSSDQPA